MSLGDYLMTFAAFFGFGLGTGGGVALGSAYILYKTRFWWDAGTGSGGERGKSKEERVPRGEIVRRWKTPEGK